MPGSRDASRSGSPRRTARRRRQPVTRRHRDRVPSLHPNESSKLPGRDRPQQVTSSPDLRSSSTGHSAARRLPCSLWELLVGSSLTRRQTRPALRRGSSRAPSPELWLGRSRREQLFEPQPAADKSVPADRGVRVPLRLRDVRPGGAERERRVALPPPLCLAERIRRYPRPRRGHVPAWARWGQCARSSPLPPGDDGPRDELGTRGGWIIVRDVLLVGPWHHEEERAFTRRRAPPEPDDYLLYPTKKVYDGRGPEGQQKLAVRVYPKKRRARRQSIAGGTASSKRQTLKTSRSSATTPTAASIGASGAAGRCWHLSS